MAAVVDGEAQRIGYALELDRPKAEAAADRRGDDHRLLAIAVDENRPLGPIASDTGPWPPEQLRGHRDRATAASASAEELDPVLAGK